MKDLPGVRYHVVRGSVNAVMRDGSAARPSASWNKSFDIVEERTGDDPLKVFK